MKKLFAALLAMTMMFSLVACGGTTSTSPSPSASTEPTAPVEEGLGVDEIVVGIVAPQTGASAFMGAGQVQGIQMAIDKLNANGGVKGVPLRLVVRDDESDPTKSLTYTEEVVLSEGAHFMIGQSNSACGAATAEFTTEEEILVFHTTATSPTIIDPELYPYSFRIHASNDSQAKGLVNLAVNAGYKEAVIMGDTSDLGVTGMASLNNYADQYGLTITDEISFVNGDSDLSAVANAIKASCTDLVLSYAMGADSAKILEALNRVDYLDKVTIIGYSGSISPNVVALGSTLDLSKVYGVDTADKCVPQSASNKALYDEFTKTYGRYTLDGSGRTTNTYCALRSYEAVMMAAWAIENTGSLEGPVLAEYIENNIAEYDSVLFDNNYTYSATDHEGWNPDNIVTIYADSVVDDGVNYFGDVNEISALASAG